MFQLLPQENTSFIGLSDTNRKHITIVKILLKCGTLDKKKDMPTKPCATDNSKSEFGYIYIFKETASISVSLIPLHDNYSGCLLNERTEVLKSDTPTKLLLLLQLINKLLFQSCSAHCTQPGYTLLLWFRIKKGKKKT